MPLQTATNPETGETVVLVGNDWQKADQTASNDKGEKAYLVGGKWLTDAPTKPADATAGDRTAAGVSGVNRGIAGLVGLPVDTAENIVNLGIAGVGSLANAAGRPDLAPNLLHGTPGGSESITRVMNTAGIGTDNPRPDDAASRMLHTGGVIAGGSIVPGARPLPTAAASVGGALASEGARQVGAPNPDAYAAVGAMAPAAGVQAAQGVKTAIADRVKPRMEAFKQAGAEPSVGQATELNFIQGFENLLSKFPGGQGILRKFSEKQQEQLGANAKTGVSSEDAGRAIETGVKGFIARTKQTWQQLDDQVAAKIPQGSAFAPSNTVQALDTLTAPVAGAEKTTGALVNPKLAEIRQNIAADLQANNGVMPFEAIRALRSKVGAMLDDSLVSGIPGGELKKLYGALSKDLESAATQAGAGKEFARQNDFYRSRMDRIENTLERVVGKTPEETFARFMPKDANQVSTVRATMRSLDPEQRKIVTDAVVERLGRASPGKQDAAGEVFSPETFLTNWNKLSPGAKQQIFNDPVMRKNMDALADVGENLRSGAKVFANPSGTAGAAAPMGIGYLGARAAVNLATGDVAGAVHSAGTAGMLMGGAALGAKMLTDKRVVEWLAQYPKVSPEAAPLHLARLGVIFNETKDEKLKQELGDFIQSVK
jgi:hypothetical protein